MASLAKRIMGFIKGHRVFTFAYDAEHHNEVFLDWTEDAESQLNEFLKPLVDARLRDAKQEVESLRMELRETRKTLEKANEDFDQLQWDV